MSSSNAGSVCSIRLTNSNGETKSPDNQKTPQERAGVAILQSSSSGLPVDTLTELFGSFAVELVVRRPLR